MDEIAKLKRLQALTLVVLLGTLGLAVASRLDRMHAPPVTPPTPAPVVATPEPGPVEDTEARRSLAQLGSRVAALEGAPPPRPGARVVASYDRRFSCRITNQRGRGLAAEVQPLDGSARPQLVVLSGEKAQSNGRIAIAQDLGPVGQDRHGLLVVQALVRTDNGIHEKEAHPHKLSLACVDRAGNEQSLELAGDFFLAASQPEDLLLKTAANTGTFAVGDGSRLDLVVDVPTLRSYLTEAGLLEVVFRLGPLVVFDGPVQR
jgi:hypothetical protein